MKHTLKKRSPEKGQSFMELAISITFLLILLMVVIDLGWAFYMITAMRDAAQEAGAYASMCPDLGDPAGVGRNRIIARLRQSASAPLDMADVDFTNDFDITYFRTVGGVPTEINPTDVKVGDSIEIVFRMTHHIVVPFAGTFLNNATDYPLEVRVVDTVLRTKVSDCH